MNELTFNESEIKELIKDTIIETFITDDKTEEADKKDYWYKLFGNREFDYYESLDESEPNFPCFVLEFLPTPDERFVHSTQVEQCTIVNFTLQHFNTRVGEKSKEQIGTEINYRIKQILQKTFKVKITTNEQVINLNDTQVYRRIIRGSFGYDNKNKVFYRGE